MEYSQSLNELFNQIDHLKVTINALRPFSEETQGRIMQKFRLDWNYHSNAIEGNQLTYGETLAFLSEGLTAKGKPFKDHLDIKGHNEGIDYLLSLIKEQTPLTEKAIRELHVIILKEPYTQPAQTPEGQSVEKMIQLGVYKQLLNSVLTPTGQMRFYATPEETPAMMNDLLSWLRKHQDLKDLHPLALAALFHHRFSAIHPFDDGNGRMARLISNLLLMQDGFPPVIIRQSDKQNHYYALRQADAGDIGAFIEYMGENLLHSLQVQLKGAKGEAMDDHDDLDKEIALLKAGIANNDEVIPKSDERAKELYTTTFIPLFQEIQKQCAKLNDLFFDHEDAVLLGKSGEKQKSVKDWEWKDLLKLPDLGHFIIAETIVYEYTWREFKTTSHQFTLLFRLTVSFGKFQYEIETHGAKNEMKIVKKYGQALSTEEYQTLSQLFVKEAIQQIKNRTTHLNN
jgi:Fic family protein